jgi:hypothetical protein
MPVYWVGCLINVSHMMWASILYQLFTGLEAFVQYSYLSFDESRKDLNIKNKLFNISYKCALLAISVQIRGINA